MNCIRRIFRHSYKSDYGQAGKLTFFLEKCTYDLQFRTIWEDFTNIEIEGGKEEQWEFLEDDQGRNLKLTHFEPNIGPISIIADIPEYYSLNGLIRGNVSHISGMIDAKIHGDLDLEVHGNLQLNKVRSQEANLKVYQGNLKIEKYLEGETVSLNLKETKTMIKKLSTSKLASIVNEGGSIDIRAVYSQVDPSPENFSIEGKSLTETLAYYQSLKNKAHLAFRSKKSDKLVLNNVHGGFHAVVEDAKSFHINELNSSLFSIHQQAGDCHIGIGRDCSGIIYVPNGQTTFYSSCLSNIQIYDLKLNRFIISNPEKPICYFYGHLSGIEETSAYNKQKNRRINIS